MARGDSYRMRAYRARAEQVRKGWLSAQEASLCGPPGPIGWGVSLIEPGDFRWSPTTPLMRQAALTLARAVGSIQLLVRIRYWGPCDEESWIGTARVHPALSIEGGGMNGASFAQFAGRG